MGSRSNRVEPGLYLFDMPMAYAEKIEIRDAPEETRDRVDGPCWCWRGANSGKKSTDPERPDEGGRGYAKARYDGGQPKYVHRTMYELFTGEKIGENVLDHICRVRRCINPRHVEKTDVLTNTLRGQAILYQIAHKYHPNPEGGGPWDDDIEAGEWRRETAAEAAE